MELKETNKKGMWISQELIDNPELDWVNKALLAEIQSLSKLELGCIISNEKLGMMLNLHKGNISRRVSWLETNGYIKLLLQKQGVKKTLRKIFPTYKDFVATPKRTEEYATTQLRVSDNATTSKRKRTEEYADTQQGVSDNATRSKRKRSTTKSVMNSTMNSSTNPLTKSLTKPLTNTEQILCYGVSLSGTELEEEKKYRNID